MEDNVSHLQLKAGKNGGRSAGSPGSLLISVRGAEEANVSRENNQSGKPEKRGEQILGESTTSMVGALLMEKSKGEEDQNSQDSHDHGEDVGSAGLRKS